jgi:hypothetical protein
MKAEVQCAIYVLEMPVLVACIQHFMIGLPICSKIHWGYGSSAFNISGAFSPLLPHPTDYPFRFQYDNFASEQASCAQHLTLIVSVIYGPKWLNNKSSTVGP